jgi:nucleolar protein TMA23
MDAAGLLKKQGWRGLGHSLDSSNKGLCKPLLVTKKVDVLGIGINKSDVIAGQWWLKAFDSSLKDFGTGKKSILSNVKEHGVNRGGLYGRFVQGEGVPGTFGLVDAKVAAVASAALLPSVTAVEKKKKRKADGDNDDNDERTERKKAKKEKSLLDLPEEKRKQYEERAAAKGLSVETYFSLRQVKNLEAKAIRRSGTSTPVTTTTTTTTEPISKDSTKGEKKKDKKSSKKDKKPSKE